ncbi:hypothetical protein [Zavarzinia sp.]|uniref:hypothetical protein n=1 Tax=Zavarzinia sp. TaxID=2027920 RepID=UPI003567E9F5
MPDNSNPRAAWSAAAVAVAACLLVVTPGSAKNNGSGHGNGNGNGHGQGGVETVVPVPSVPSVTILFPSSDRQLISNYYLRNSGSVADLPPGLRRQLVTRGHLPPGLAKKALPPGLASQLSPVPAGYERLIAGPDVLLVEIATGLIVDILRDVVR